MIQVNEKAFFREKITSSFPHMPPLYMHAYARVRVIYVHTRKKSDLGTSYIRKNQKFGILGKQLFWD